MQVGQDVNGITWFQIVQTFGILTGFLLAAYAAFRERRARRVSNYIQLVMAHRDLWKITIDTEDYDRVLTVDPNLNVAKINKKERRFLNFLFLHMTCSFELHRTSNIINIENMRYDIRGVLSAPIARRFWEENKRYYNSRFVDFVDACAPNVGDFPVNTASSVVISHNGIIEPDGKFEITSMQPMNLARTARNQKSRKRKSKRRQ